MLDVDACQENLFNQKRNSGQETDFSFRLSVARGFHSGLKIHGRQTSIEAKASPEIIKDQQAAALIEAILAAQTKDTENKEGFHKDTKKKDESRETEEEDTKRTKEHTDEQSNVSQEVLTTENVLQQRNLHLSVPTEFLPKRSQSQGENRYVCQRSRQLSVPCVLEDPRQTRNRASYLLPGETHRDMMERHMIDQHERRRRLSYYNITSSLAPSQSSILSRQRHMSTSVGVESDNHEEPEDRQRRDFYLNLPLLL